MSEKNEVAVVETKGEIMDKDILNPTYNFDEKIEVAGKVATSLKNVIDSQGFSIKIGANNEYVTVEGWETLGTMLGCTPFVEEVVEIPSENTGKFAYKATVSIRQGDNILSRAIAVAERNKMQSDRPSVYSMAQTRALGKAYRLALGWIVKMAGYEPTPAEEMQEIQRKEGFERAKKKTRKQKTPTDFIDAETK